MTIKINKNPARNNPLPRKNYIPNYQLMGIEPEKAGANVASVHMKPPFPKKQIENGRIIAAPTVESSSASPSSRSGFIPNVGNIDRSWSGFDNNIIDDISGENADLDPNHPMIDNNEFVSEAALNQIGGQQFRPPISIEEDASPTIFAPPPTIPDIQHSDNSDFLSIVSELQDNSYLLIVNGVPLCSGPKEEIQEQAEAMLYGDHERCEGTPISPNDLLILKKVGLNFGLHLE